MKRDFAIGAAWNTVAGCAGQAASAAIFFATARLIGVEDFGVAAIAFALLFVGEFLVRDTITEAIVERKTLEEGRLEATFFTLVGFSLAICLALCAVAQVAAEIYREPQVAALLSGASPTVLMIGFAGVSTAILRRKLAFRILAIRYTLGVLCGGAVGLAMATNGMGPWSLVGQRLAEVGFNSLFAFRAAGWMPKRWPTRAEFALVRGLGPRVVLMRASMIVIAQTPTVALGIFAEPRAAGLYALAARSVEIAVVLIVKPLQAAAQSTLAAMRRRRQATGPFYLELTELAALFAFPAFAGFALIASPTVRLLLGPAWRDAAAILPPLCIAGAVASLTSMQEAYLLARDRLQGFVAAVLIEAAVGMVLIGLAARFGAVTVGWAVALRALASLPLCTRAALAAEMIPAAKLLHTLAAPALLAAAVAATVGTWRLVAYGRLSDVAFVASAIAIGVLAAGVVLLRLMPKALARLRSFTQAQQFV